jgi:pyruvate,water dikinase
MIFPKNIKKWLLSLEDSKEEEIGRKAQNLKKLLIHRDSYLIPKTVIFTTRFFDWLKERKFMDFKEKKIKIPKKILNESLKEIRKIFGRHPLVVRSSVTCEDSPLFTFAGQYSTFLNIKSDLEIKKAILLCYKSFFSPNAQIYARLKNVKLEKEKIAVIIQECIPTKISGVMFTANPVTGNLNEILVEYTKGFGDRLMAGEIKSHLFRIQKETKKLNKFSLRLKKIAFSIENIFCSPQNIEWGFDGKNFYIFQARPINLRKKFKEGSESKIINKNFRLIERGQVASPGKARGRLIIIRKLKDYLKIKREVIVLNAGEPTFTRRIIPYLEKISGMLLPGGILSHAAEIAREFNKPCLANIESTKMGKFANKEIFLDGIKGQVLLVKEEK